MDELPQKTSRWTPTVIVSMVLMLTFILLEIRLLLRTTPTSKETLFPITLFVVAGLVMMLKFPENTPRTIRVIGWLIMMASYLLGVATYLRIS